MKKFLHLEITNKEGIVSSLPLKLSESHLISKIAQENNQIFICCIETDEENFKIIFG